jgi:TolB-like protein/DNA-binding winged helix-turn-helix (wHTH) protein/Tfp pilus assembly protein PilF
MQIRTSDESTIRFGPFELLPRSGELKKNGAVVRLQPQPFKVLVFLATKAGQLITREELQQKVWAGETFVDFEHGLNFCIKQIRAALGDNAQSPLYIETLPRRGYRFIAHVEKVEDQISENGSQPDVEIVKEKEKLSEEIHQPAFTKPDSRWWRSTAILIFVIALIIAVYFTWKEVGRPSVPATGKVMLAVLPFDNLTSDTEQDYFSDGLTEEMISQLGRLQPERLGVIARTSIMNYKGAKKDIHQIGDELGVDYVLEGSVRRTDDRVRVTAQLIQVSDQTHLWSESYDRTREDALKIQSEVAYRIARSLAFELLSARPTNLAPGSTASIEAYDAYLRGRYLWNKGTRSDIKKSIEYFEQAISYDQNYGLAYAGLADSHRYLAMYYAVPVSEAMEKAKAAAIKAIEINDAIAEAHTALGTIRFRYEWDWAGAEREFQRAVELNPGYGLAHHDYAWFLVAMGRFEEGLAEMQRARELDPLSPVANADVGWVYMLARRYDEAIDQMRRTLELEPGFGSAEACLVKSYVLKGQYAEAFEAARKEMVESGASGEEMAAIEQNDPKEGMKAIYRWQLNRRFEAAKQRALSSEGFAALYAAIGEKDKAFEWLEKAVKERDFSIASIKVDPDFDPLRSDPRFDALLKKIGFNAK